MREREKRRWWVYILRDPRDNAVRYVGRTRDRAARLRAHILGSPAHKNRRKNDWIRELLEAGLKPVMEPVQSGSGNGSLAAETRWIFRYRQSGADLLNIVCPPPHTKVTSLEKLRWLREHPRSKRRERQEQPEPVIDWGEGRAEILRQIEEEEKRPYFDLVGAFEEMYRRVVAYPKLVVDGKEYIDWSRKNEVLKPLPVSTFMTPPRSALKLAEYWDLAWAGGYSVMEGMRGWFDLQNSEDSCAILVSPKVTVPPSVLEKIFLRLTTPRSNP
jgi:hypothetical protein